MENEETVKVESTLEDFSWDFGTEEPVKIVDKEETKVEKETEEKEDDLDVDSVLDFDEEEEETPEAEKEDKKVETTKEKLLGSLKDEGVFSTIEFEDKEYSDDDIPILFEQELDNRANEIVDGFMEDLDEEGMAFLKFKMKGGSTQDFLKAYTNSSTRPKGDLDSETHQERVVEFMLTQHKGESLDEARERVEYLKEKGHLEKYAKNYEELLDKEDAKQQKEILKQQEDLAERQKQDRKKLSEDIAKALDEVDSVKQFKFNKKDKKVLHNYVTNPTVRVSKGKYATQFQQDLSAAFKDKDKMLVIAKLLKSDFDISDILRNAKTKKTKKEKDIVDNGSTNKGNKSSTRGSRPLHTYFDE